MVASEASFVPSIELVESVPSGAIADDTSIPNTDETWLAMVRGARRSVAVGQFYVAERPTDSLLPDRLGPVVQELGAAARRGIAVRFLVDAGFMRRYPTSLDHLRSLGVTVRELDTAKLMGGVQHAKYLVVDEEDSYVGSANFDWRSLDHIHELGLRVRSRRIAAAFLAAFDGDWVAAGGKASSPLAYGNPSEPELIGDAEVLPVMSPRGHLPDPRFWDLERLVAALDGAKREIRVQLLSVELVGHDGSRFEVLDAALRRAAVRGVKVHLLLSNWQKTSKKLGAALGLAKVPGIEVRFVNVPPDPRGFIPFARVVHAKYLVVDDDVAWVGTSNWGGDYFLRSRNLGLMVRSPSLAAQLRGVFDRLAASSLAEVADPSRAYEPPRIGD